MATRVALATASSLPRSSLPSLAAKLAPHRGLTSGGDHHGPPKVNIWEDPLSPSKWKEEHFSWLVRARLWRIQAFYWKEGKEGRG
ncbi:uncharacterized protein [Elaeis guineensis]|uniref:uncharacterized protein isoform X4 n=1 Tax=Elaeis guineensis var. tenera TaxID=51953 RepID=UPI00057A4F56